MNLKTDDTVLTDHRFDEKEEKDSLSCSHVPLMGCYPSFVLVRMETQSLYCCEPSNLWLHQRGWCIQR